MQFLINILKSLFKKLFPYNQKCIGIGSDIGLSNQLTKDPSPSPIRTITTTITAINTNNDQLPLQQQQQLNRLPKSQSCTYNKPKSSIIEIENIYLKLSTTESKKQQKPSHVSISNSKLINNTNPTTLPKQNKPTYSKPKLSKLEIDNIFLKLSTSPSKKQQQKQQQQQQLPYKKLNESKNKSLATAASYLPSSSPNKKTTTTFRHSLLSTNLKSSTLPLSKYKLNETNQCGKCVSLEHQTYISSNGNCEDEELNKMFSQMGDDEQLPSLPELVNQLYLTETLGGMINQFQFENQIESLKELEHQLFGSTDCNSGKNENDKELEMIFSQMNDEEELSSLSELYIDQTLDGILNQFQFENQIESLEELELQLFGSTDCGGKDEKDVELEMKISQMDDEQLPSLLELEHQSNNGYYVNVGTDETLNNLQQKKFYEITNDQEDPLYNSSPSLTNMFTELRLTFELLKDHFLGFELEIEYPHFIL